MQGLCEYWSFSICMRLTSKLSVEQTSLGDSLQPVSSSFVQRRLDFFLHHLKLVQGFERICNLFVRCSALDVYLVVHGFNVTSVYSSSLHTGEFLGSGYQDEALVREVNYHAFPSSLATQNLDAYSAYFNCWHRDFPSEMVYRRAYRPYKLILSQEPLYDIVEDAGSKHKVVYGDFLINSVDPLFYFAVRHVCLHGLKAVTHDAFLSEKA
jgi:hypothetical protein